MPCRTSSSPTLIPTCRSIFGGKASSVPLDKKLWGWVDRLIYDSAEWKTPAEQFQLVRKIRTLTEVRTILCDLNWTRLVGSRFALAQLFDHSCALARVGKIQNVSISCANHTAGLLLLGWLAAQLGWKLQPTEDFFFRRRQAYRFRDSDNGGSGPDQMRFRLRGCQLEIRREPNSDYFQARIGCEGVSDAVMLAPAGRSEPADILVAELSRGGNHPLYRRSLAAIDALFAAPLSRRQATVALFVGEMIKNLRLVPPERFAD